MPDIKMMLSMQIDGKPATGFPLLIEQTVAELQGTPLYIEPGDSNDTTFSAIPLDQITTLQFFFLRAIDRAVGVRLEGGEAGNVAIRIGVGGIILVMNGTITRTNATINVNSASTASVDQLGGGV